MQRTPDQASKVAEATEMMNAQDDWLVLFQSYSAFNLPGMSVADVSKPGSPFSYVTSEEPSAIDLENQGPKIFGVAERSDTQILEDLVGESVTCASFTGKYRAAADQDR